MAANALATGWWCLTQIDPIEDTETLCLQRSHPLAKKSLKHHRGSFASSPSTSAPPWTTLLRRNLPTASRTFHGSCTTAAATHCTALFGTTALVKRAVTAASTYPPSMHAGSFNGQAPRCPTAGTPYSPPKTAPEPGSTSIQAKNPKSGTKGTRSGSGAFKHFFRGFLIFGLRPRTSSSGTDVPSSSVL